MKRALRLALFSILFLSGACHSRALDYPHYVGRVNDFAHVLDAHTGEQVEDYLTRIVKDDGPEIAVAIVPNLEGKTPEAYAQGLMNAWGIRSNRGGVIILISMAERQIWVQTNTAAAKWLDRDACQFIYNDILRPAIRKKQWGEALLGAAQRISETYQGHALEIIPENKVAKLDETLPPIELIEAPDTTFTANFGSDSNQGPVENSGPISEKLVIWGVVGTSLLVILLWGWELYRANRKAKGGYHEGTILFERWKPIKLSPAKKKALLRKFRLAHIQHERKKKADHERRMEEAKAHKLARFLRKAVKARLKTMNALDRKRAHKILYNWKKAEKSDRRWVANRIPCMNHYVNYQHSNGGFGVMDFLFWHWMLFPQDHSSGSAWSAPYHAPSSDYSSSPSAEWSAPSFGSSDFGGFSGGDSGASSSGAGGGF